MFWQGTQLTRFTRFTRAKVPMLTQKPESASYYSEVLNFLVFIRTSTYAEGAARAISVSLLLCKQKNVRSHSGSGLQRFCLCLDARQPRSMCVVCVVCVCVCVCVSASTKSWPAHLASEHATHVSSDFRDFLRAQLTAAGTKISRSTGTQLALLVHKYQY
jgi:hypothetical protein